MATLTEAAKGTIRARMTRARARLDGAAAAISRHSITEGEFDNNFDGVVTAIFHVADAVELARTGRGRKVGEGEAATVIRAVVAFLTAEKVGSVPAPARLIDLNTRRNTSVHGEWVEVLDHDALEDAIEAARAFWAAAADYLGRLGVSLTS